MPPLDAPIFMLPLAGMLFLLGAVLHQLAGCLVSADEGAGWMAATVVGLAFQIGAFVILIAA